MIVQRSNIRKNLGNIKGQIIGKATPPATKKPSRYDILKPRIKPPPIQQVYVSVPYKIPIRQQHDKLTTINGKITKLNLPHGSFNAGIAVLPNTDNYICVYRPDEYGFIACLLDSQFKIIENTFFNLQINNCADPRLIWINKKLLIIYSSNDDGLAFECIKGGFIMDLNKANAFIKPEIFRISPHNGLREKNWMPFINDNHLYLISTIKPHTIYELNFINDKPVCEKKFQTDWINPWFSKEFLRGNTNAVQLEDGNYLATFHTVEKINQTHFYDNGCYVFEGKPPFKVIKCANRTYLKAEDAIEKHFRKEGIILVNFPVGMIRDKERIIISYGDNDSCVKILETTIQEMLNTTLKLSS